MVDLDMWALPLMMMLMLPLMFLGVFVAQYNQTAGIVTIFGADFSMVPIMRLSRKISQWRAGLIHHIKAWFVPRGAELKYSGQQIFKWKEHPETAPVRVRNFRCPDGHIEPLVHITPHKLPRLISRVTHPRYNRGGRLPAVVYVHPLPFDLQFREDLNTTTHGGYTVKVSTVSWAVLDEIPPRIVKDLLGQAHHNLIPGIDKELLHVPWYYVAISSGTGVNQKTVEPPKLPVQVGPKGAISYPCLECGKPLNSADPEGWAKCEDGHEYFMGEPKR